MHTTAKMGVSNHTAYILTHIVIKELQIYGEQINQSQVHSEHTPAKEQKRRKRGRENALRGNTLARDLFFCISHAD
jgi:hypothetical protein